MGLSATIREEGVDEALGKVLAVLGRFVDKTPLMSRLAAYLGSSTRERFETGVGPDGKPWKPSIRAQLSGGQTLLDRGTLRDRITDAHGRDFAQVGTNDIRAPLLHFGGVVRAKKAKALAFRVAGGNGLLMKKSVTIPGRPIFGASAEDRTELVALGEDYIAEVAE